MKTTTRAIQNADTAICTRIAHEYHHLARATPIGLDTISRYASKRRGYVAVRGGVVVGFVLLLRGGKNSPVGILHIAVDPLHRRTGVGRLLIDRVHCGIPRGETSIGVAVTPESNLDAQLFFRSMGWVGALLPGMYKAEDAIEFSIFGDHAERLLLCESSK